MLKQVQHDGWGRWRGLAALLALLLVSIGATAAPAQRQGIDVSHHQGRIDWQKLPKQGVSFAYVKASEGGSHRDRLFAANWADAKAAGIQRGAYHYFTLCRAGADQAANFIATVPVDAGALAPAVDLEFLGNCNRRPPRDAFHAELAAYLRAVEARYGKPVILYLTDEFERAYDVSARVKRPLWLRSLGTEPRFGARPWSIWQQSHSKRLEGIATPVDWNVMR
ncbi:lysozyme [Sphingomonas sp. DBB INV C78]|uniref:GH25 family lysozyme n=1 Tax=Sphingomonas sp. DBB INV C78 TaxID=3349434 RepID=UPI0036D2B5EB